MDNDTTTSSSLPNPSGSVTPDSSTLLRPTESSSPSPSSVVVARSQSPAKRLKSEEPPNRTPIPDTPGEEPEPMDEDTQPSRPEMKREASVDMLDGTVSSLEGLPEASTVSIASSAAPSTAATAVSAQPSSTTTASISSASRPSIEEQTQIVFQAKLAPQMVEGAVWYIISGRWLNKFLAQSQEGVVLSKEDIEGELGPIDNSDLVDTNKLEDGAKKSDDSGDADEISISENLIPIKPGSYGEDFEILPESVWNSLVSWYGLAKGSPVIKRKVVNTSESGEQENLQFEYYPPAFTVHKLRDPVLAVTQNSLAAEKRQSPKKVIAAKAEIFQKFLKKVKKLAGVDPTRKVRLWRVFSASEDEVEPTPKGAKKSGKEKGASIFEQLSIDLGAFLDLKLGSERELVDLKDVSNDGNYNGSLRIAAAGLGAGGTIVLEEQSPDGAWISDKAAKVITRFGQKVTVAQHGKTTAVVSKKKVPSRSSSPSASSSNAAPKGGIMTRGRREGRTQGTCGLSNLGNTCYMNSALQCLRSVKELSKYFISDEYEKELNPGNPLAHHGKVAKAYASLLKNVLSPTCPASFSPREFKSTIGRFGPSFQGYGQQDSQEFLAFLLDGLHEDLNRIQKKPYIEKPESTDEMVGDSDAIAQLAAAHWDIYKKRNDSAIADLFGGLYQSTLVCPTCEKVSITFDPFMDLTLPLPVENVWSKEVFFFPKDDSNGKVLRIPVEMDKNGSIKSLKEYVGNKMGIEPRKIMASEVYKTKFFKHYEDYATVSEQIQSSDDAFLYELDDIPTNYPSPKGKKPKKSLYYGSSYRFDDDEEEPHPDAPESERLLVPVFNKVYKENKFTRSPNAEGFAVPFFIVVNREEAKSIDTIMGKIVEKYQVLTTRDLYEGVPQIEEEEGEEDQDEGIEVTGGRSEKARGSDEEEEKDGFVDVSMKDASSVVESDTAEDAEKQPPKKVSKRGLPSGLGELFNVKVTKRKSGDNDLVTGWQGLEAAFDIRERLNSNPPPSPPPRKQALFPSVGNSGRMSPASQVSDEDIDNFEDAPEPQQDIMQDASDEEDDPAASFDNSYSRSGFPSGSFSAVPAGGFYGNSSGNSSKKAFKTPSRSPSPVVVDESPLIRWGEGIICEWTEAGFDAIFGGKSEDDFRGRGTWESALLRHDPELAVRRRRREDRKKKGIHLEDCLDEFAKNEILSEEDPWYCPRCKVHRRASKKFELWKCPDILVIHLKRFSSSRNFRDKIDVLIDCPVEGLDLSNRVGLKEEGQSLIYDLFGVDNHYGGLGGGHYTAYVKNWIDDKWYYCDDSNVREVYDSDKVITPAAYLLFYRRRSSKPLGGPGYERILATTEGTPEDSAEETAGSSRDSSPTRAGEGGPSDDSLISVTVNGEPRKSSGGGVSGLSTMYGERVGNSNLWGTGLSSNATTVVGDDQPPAYSAEDEEPGVEMSLIDTVQLPSVGFGFEGHTDLKDELLKDMNESDVDADVEMGGGGVDITDKVVDGDSIEIIVDDEDTITPADDHDKTPEAVDDKEKGGMIL